MRKGHVAWNKGLKGFKHKGSFKKGFDPNRIAKKGSERYNWKGEDAGYSSKHKWIVREYGRATKCEHCGKTGGLIDWANVSKQYQRSREDYKQLCRKCHIAFDYNEIMQKRRQL
jgi:hypothetical protein